MSFAVTFPDVVALVIATVDAATTAPVRKRVPATRPSQFVTVRRSGGTVSNHVIDNAQVTIDCWADTDEDAADLCAEVRAAVLGMRGTVVDGTQIYLVSEVAGPADVPDPVSDMPRMRWTVIVQTRGVASDAS